MTTDDFQFLMLLYRHGQLTVNPDRRYALFPGSVRAWSFKMLWRLRIRGYIRSTYHDPNCLVLTKWGQWKLDHYSDKRTA
jgi:hypothetical protein